jgi:hypothetical protein
MFHFLHCYRTTLSNITVYNSITLQIHFQVFMNFRISHITFFPLFWFCRLDSLKLQSRTTTPFVQYFIMFSLYGGRIHRRNWDKSLKSFPPYYSQSPLLTGFTTPPPPPTKSGLKLVCNVNIIYGKPQVWELSRSCPETSTTLYVHEFGFRTIVSVISQPLSVALLRKHIYIFILQRQAICVFHTTLVFEKTCFLNIIVPRAPEKEDLDARELLRRADSAGPVSPTCFDV